MMRQVRRLVCAGVLALLATLATAGTAFAPPVCDLTQLQLRDSTVNQGLGSYDRIVRGKETLVKMYFSMPSCHDNNDAIQITGGTLSATGAGTTLASDVVGTPTPVSAFPTAATFSTAPVNDAPADVKFVVAGSALATSATTEAYTATFSATITFRWKPTANSTPTNATRTFTSFATKTVERRTNALRVLVVPMGNAANPYNTEFPAEAVAAVENGMQTLGRQFPVPSGVGTLGGEAGGIRYAIDSTLLNVTTPYCGTGVNFDAVKAQLAQFLVSWNAANPGAQADRVVGAIWSGVSTGSSGGCADGMASLISPEAWVRAIPDAGGAPSMTGALFAMEIGHTFGLTPAARSFSTFHSLNNAADGTSPNRGYNVATRSFLADDRTAMKLSGTWNNTTTILEKEDYAFLLCVLGGQTNAECLASNVAGTAGGVAALPQAFAVTGHTDDTAAGTKAQESFKTGNLQELGTDPDSAYRLVQRGPGDVILQTDRVRVSFNESVHDDDPGIEPHHGTFAAVVPLSEAALKFQLWKGLPGTGILLWSALKTNPPTIESFTAKAAGFNVENYTNTTPASELQPALSVDGEWVAWRAEDGTIKVGPRSDSGQAVTLPRPASRTTEERIVFASDRDGDFEIYSMDALGGDVRQLTDDDRSDTGPELSRDGGQIVFIRNGDVWTAESDGSNPQELTDTSATERQPTFGPDGRIAFERQAAGEDEEIWVMNNDGSGLVQLTNNDAMESRPAWSPDGVTVAFGSTSSGQWRLWSTASDGTGEATELPGTIDGDINPAYSPSGDRVAFYRAWDDADTVDVDLFIINLDTGGRTQLFHTTDRSEFDPSWSPDATELVFYTREQLDAGQDPFGHIEAITVDGATRRSLTTNEVDDVEPDWGVSADRGAVSDPAWNQATGDGAALAFASEGDLYTIPVDLSGATPSFGQLTKVYDFSQADASPASRPSWSQDGGRLVFEEPGSEPSIHVLELDGGTTQFLSFGSFPSWSRTQGDDRIAYTVDSTDGSQIRAIDPAGDFDSELLVADARLPGWGTDGRLSFTRNPIEGPSGIWIYDVAKDAEQAVAADGFDSDLAGSTLAFNRRFFFGIEDSQTDVMIARPGGARGIDINVEVSDDNAEDLRLDLLVECDDLTYVAAVALVPDDVSGSSSTWETNFDPSLTCANPTLKVAVSDGYNRVLSSNGEEIATEQKPPTAAIYSPLEGSSFRQYELIPALGSGWDAEDGTLPAGQLAWLLTGPGVSIPGTGPSLDFSPPTGGFPLGAYTLKLTATDLAGNSDSVTRSFVIVKDADNDGLTFAEEAQGCVTYNSAEYPSPDDDPLNAFLDNDGDGIVNVDDPALCAAASEYEASIEFDPASMDRGSNGVVTARVRIAGRNMADVSMAYVKSINGIDVSSIDELRAGQWNVARGTNVGQAKIDRTPLNAFFAEHLIANQNVRIVIAGTGGNGTWTFEGVGTLGVR